MEFRRINNLPPYVFTVINQIKIDERKAGNDVVDLGFGNPDIPSSTIAVEKLVDAARNGRNHRYSLSRGLFHLRAAVAQRYSDNFNVSLDPETQIIATIGAKEGLSHLMWVLLEPGDAALAPTPAYPIHNFAPRFAGAHVQNYLVGDGVDPVESFKEAYAAAPIPPRVGIISFPNNPTTQCVDLAQMTEFVEFAREKNMVLVHDFAYSDNGYDGYKPPSVLEVPGASDVAVELWTTTKSFSMAGWRMAFMVGNPELVSALGKLKSYLDYGTFQPIQIATTVVMTEDSDYPEHVNSIYESRREVLCAGLQRIGWNVEKPKGTMFVWAPIPEPYREMGSMDLAKMLVREAHVATSVGVGFGDGGEGYVRFALIENEQRILQAVRGLRRALTKL